MDDLDALIFIARQHSNANARDTDTAILSLRPYVRHILVLYRNGLTYRHNFLTTR